MPSIAVTRSPKGAIWYMGLNQKNENLAKPEVREALKWLVDYEAHRRLDPERAGEVHQAFLPRGFLGAIEDTPYRFDLAKGKELWPRPGCPTASRSR